MRNSFGFADEAVSAPSASRFIWLRPLGLLCASAVNLFLKLAALFALPGKIFFMSLPISLPKYDSDLESIEINLLLEGIYRRYGYDFREYAISSLRRRLWNVIRTERVATISALQEKILHNSDCMDRFLLA